MGKFHRFSEIQHPGSDAFRVDDFLLITSEKGGLKLDLKG